MRYIIDVKLIVDENGPATERKKIEALKQDIEALILQKYHPSWDLQIHARTSKSDIRYI